VAYYLPPGGSSSGGYGVDLSWWKAQYKAQRPARDWFRNIFDWVVFPFVGFQLGVWAWQSWTRFATVSTLLWYNPGDLIPSGIRVGYVGGIVGASGLAESIYHAARAVAPYVPPALRGLGQLYGAVTDPFRFVSPPTWGQRLWRVLTVWWDAGAAVVSAAQYPGGSSGWYANW
jgi:hypothetical protein